MRRFWYVRSARTAVLLVAALTLLGLSILGLTLCMIRLVSGTWPAWITSFLEDLKTVSWLEPSVIAVLVGLGMLGLILLLAALVPGQRHTTLLAWDALSRKEEWTVHRQGIARLAQYEAERTDGVQRAKATFRGNTLAVTVVTPLHDTHEVKRSVREHVDTRLGRIPLVQQPKVKTRIAWRKNQ